MIRRSLRKYKDDDNTEKEDSDSENNINSVSDSDEYIPSESDEGNESDEDNESQKNEVEEYNNINNKKRKPEEIFEDEDIPNIKLNEKILKGNVILVLNNRDYVNNYEDDEDYDDENDNTEDDNINIENIEENVKKKKKYNDILIKYNRDEKKYFNNLNEEEKNRILNLEDNLKINDSNDIPTRFKLLDFGLY